MKWRKAKNGEKRTARMFALFPVTIGDQWVWLERYNAELEMMEMGDSRGWVLNGRSQ